MDGKSFPEAMKRIETSLPSQLQQHWKVWSIAQLINVGIAFA
jgi:hypothetical protein